MDYVIRQPDLTQSVERYQPAVDQAMVSLNLAVWPGAWRMPARMIINTESTVGYNNKLKQAGAGMKLAINNEVNPDTQKSWPLSNGRRGIKNQPAKQSASKPDSQSRNDI